MNILVIFTGGTIGCTLQNEWVCIDSATKFTLLNNYKKKISSDIHFDTISLYSILSENLSSTELTSLTNCINSHLNEDYDGIIVTHGTDTLQYMASTLCYTLKELDIPVILVSANYPLNSKKSNGNINFEAAVSFIENKAGNGVFVSYKNSLDNSVSFHWGTRLQLHAENSDNLYSINNEIYASYRDGEIVYNDDFKIVRRNVLCSDIVFCEKPNILTINSRPADSFLYDLERYNAVIFIPYHSGTLNTENSELISFCKKAMTLDIPVFVVDLRSEYVYDSTKKYNELGLVKLPLCSFPSIYIKVWLGISLKKDLKSFVQMPLSGEFIS